MSVKGNNAQKGDEFDEAIANVQQQKAEELARFSRGTYTGFQTHDVGR